MTRSEKPTLVLRNVSLTMRHRLTPAMTCSTSILKPEMIRLRKTSSAANSLPLGFFWLRNEHTGWLISLKATILTQRGRRRIGYIGLVSHFLVMGLAWLCWTEIEYPVGLGIDYQQVFVRMGFLLAAVMLSLFLTVLGSLPPTFSAIYQQIGWFWQQSVAGGQSTRFPFWFHFQRGQRLLQHGQQTVYPLVGLGLAHLKMQALHRLQRVRLLVHQDKEQFVFHPLQLAFDTTTSSTLSWCASYRRIATVLPLVSLGKGQQQPLKLGNGHSGCAQKIFWFCFQQFIGHHGRELYLPFLITDNV